MRERIDGFNFKIRKDLGGEPIRLTLKLKEIYEDKEYNLYTIYKIKEVDGKDEYLPLYTETFTRAQYNRFFDDPTYYIPVRPKEEGV